MTGKGGKMDLRTKAENAANKARELKRKSKLKKARNEKERNNVYYVYARGRRPIFHEAKNLVEALKWALSNIPKQDLLEIHDKDYQLLWGRHTGINKDNYNESHGIQK